MSGIADRKEHYDIYKKDGNPVGYPSFMLNSLLIAKYKCYADSE